MLARFGQLAKYVLKCENNMKEIISQSFWHLICQNRLSIDNSMAPQRWKVPISIVAVIPIDHTDWLDIMVDDLNHLSPHVLISNVIQFFWFPNVWKLTDGYRYTSFTYLNRPIWIDIIMNPHSCIKHTNKTTSLIYH